VAHVIRTCVAAIVLSGFALSARAQDVAQYLALARQYAAGQGDTATARLGAWSLHDVEAAASRATDTGSVHDLMAAAMLHTDLANTIIDTQPEAARFHFNKALSALTVAGYRIGPREHLNPFIRRWFRFVAGVYTSCELLKEAEDQVQTALLRFPTDPQLFVARGVILEVAVRKTLVPDWRRDTVFGVSNRHAVEDMMTRAGDQFLHALSIDSHNAEAHLHLGWVRFFLADGRAKAELDAALAEARDDGVRYLAHLFLGGLAERENRLEDARREFERARDAGPEYQSPYVALSRIEQALGHDDRARELALTALRLDKLDGDDPWWDHRIGFDRESLYWLRDEVRRPQ
jgi:tetratricopeptide (TPR) repeat protein